MNHCIARGNTSIISPTLTSIYVYLYGAFHENKKVTTDKFVPMEIQDSHTTSDRNRKKKFQIVSSKSGSVVIYELWSPMRASNIIVI